MKFSYSWLKELVPGLSVTPSQLAELLTMHSFETVVAEEKTGDTLLETDIATNRADCLSHVGLAREIGALLTLPVQEPTVSTVAMTEYASGEWTASISQPRHMTRYMGAVMKDIVVRDAPAWMKQRLEFLGMRSINGLVDITNYVMLEIGNPTHAFDAHKLPGKDMSVRFGKRAETITTLDGAERPLSSNILVITSNDQPVDIAGAMGGQSSEVGDTTSEIFLLVGRFNPYTIQKSTSLLGLKTEGSLRFSKGLDPELAEQALRRSITLMQEHLGATVVQIIDVYPKPIQRKPIVFRPARASIVAGTDITPETIHDIFKRLHFTVDATGKRTWKVTVPTWRPDIVGEHDLVEEALRVVGYNSIQPTIPSVPLRAQPVADTMQWQEVIQDTLVSVGATEVYSYVYEDSRFSQLLGLTTIKHLELKNPVAPELKYLRVSVLPGLLKSVEKNTTQVKKQLLFEVGHVFYPRVSEEPVEFSDARVPNVIEELRLACVMVGSKDQFRAIKGIIDELGNRLGLSDLRFREYNPNTSEVLSVWQYSQVAEVVVGEHTIGVVGLLSQTVADSLKVPEIAFFDLHADALVGLAQAGQQYTPLPKYPPVYRDIALLVDPEIKVERVQNIIERVGGELLGDADLFDIYVPTASEATGVTQKSLAFHLRFQAPDRTLNSSEVEALQKNIVKALEDELGAQAR